MFFKIYLIVLSLCLFCLIILMHLQSLNCFRKPYANRLVGGEYNSSIKNVSLIGGEGISEESGEMGSEQRKKSHDSIDGGAFSGHFDITQLNNHLKLCIRTKDNEVDMDEYIFTFQQLYKFFCMLGTVFGFVGSDVKSKLEILQAYRDGENKTHYETVEKMIAFEKNTDFVNKNKESSGSRTFLRLHRALNFVSKFLSKVETLKETEGTYHISKEAYSQTLSKFHPWLIQNGAKLAMLALPIKKDLIARVCDGKIEASAVGVLLKEVIQSTEKVYDQCEKVYKENDLLSLP